MKFTIFIICLIFIISINAQTTEKINTTKDRIAVLELDIQGELASAKLILTDRLRSEIFSIGEYNVMERGQMAEIMKEQGFQNSGACSDQACIVALGEVLGVDKMLGGSIGKLGDLFLINLRLIDIRTGQILKSYSVDCNCPIEDLPKAMKNAAMNISSKKKDVIIAPLESKIKIEKKKVNINKENLVPSVSINKKNIEIIKRISVKFSSSNAYSQELDDLIYSYFWRREMLNLNDFPDKNIEEVINSYYIDNAGSGELNFSYGINKSYFLIAGLGDFGVISENLYSLDDFELNVTGIKMNLGFGYNKRIKNFRLYGIAGLQFIKTSVDFAYKYEEIGNYIINVDANLSSTLAGAKVSIGLDWLFSKKISLFVDLSISELGGTDFSGTAYLKENDQERTPFNAKINKISFPDFLNPSNDNEDISFLSVEQEITNPSFDIFHDVNIDNIDESSTINISLQTLTIGLAYRF